MEIIIIVILVLSSLILGSCYRKKLLIEMFNLLNIASNDHDEKNFLATLNNPKYKMLISKATYIILKLKFYLKEDNHQKIIDIHTKKDRIKFNKNDQLAYYKLLYSYFVDYGYQQDAKNLLKEIHKNYDNQNDLAIKYFIYDCDMIDDIYFNKNITRILEIEKLISSISNQELLSVYNYRLAKLYSYQKNIKKATDCLIIAKNNTHDELSINKINNILKGDWYLL